MAYGLSTRAFIEDGPADRADQLRRSRTTARSWTILDRDRRLALIECALGSANHRSDGFPLAL